MAAAFKYLNSQLDSLEDTYSMALLAYAYALAGMEEFDQVYEKLQESAINSGKKIVKNLKIYWTSL